MDEIKDSLLGEDPFYGETYVPATLGPMLTRVTAVDRSSAPTATAASRAPRRHTRIPLAVIIAASLGGAGAIGTAVAAATSARSAGPAVVATTTTLAGGQALRSQTGSSSTPMPTLLGLSVSDATSSLEALGFAGSHITVVTLTPSQSDASGGSAYPEGTVLSQNPASDTALSADTSFVLRVTP